MTASTRSGYLPIPLVTYQGKRCKQSALPSTMLLLGILNNAGGRVPAHLTNRIPPGRIPLVTEHDNVPWCVAVSLLHFVLNLPDTALEHGNGWITLIQRYIVAVPMKIVSAGVNRNVL